MTRRLILTIVGIVAASLVVATGGSLLVYRVEARVEAREDLRDEAVRLASHVEAVQAPDALAVVVRALRLEGANVMVVTPDGRIRGEAPPGLTREDLDLDVPALRRGQAQTGEKDGVVFAAAPAPTPTAGPGSPVRPGPGGGLGPRGEGLLVLVLARQVGSAVPVASPWFVVALLATLAAAAALAVNLARRLTLPLRQTEDTTRRIAAGDLAARVPVRENDGTELAGLARSVNAMAESLERSRGLERQFLLAVSHDLRTPLTSIRGFAEALSEGRAPDPEHAAEIIGAEARRLERLVADLLELAKLGSRRFSLDVRATDLTEVAVVTVEGFRPAAESAGLALHVIGSGSDAATASGSPLAAADPDRLAQVVANLLENAVRFADARVEVGVRADGQAAVIWVDDDGPGIPAEDLEHVFEPFHRSSRPAPRQMGSGLGLAIVSQLVTAMGGSVRAENLPGSGARMVVTLRTWHMAPSSGGRFLQCDVGRQP